MPRPTFRTPLALAIIVGRRAEAESAAIIVSSSLLTVLAALAAPPHLKMPWPDLRVLKNYPNPVHADGTCGPEGAASPQSETGRSSALKNRYKHPADLVYESFDFDRFSRLPLGPGGAPPKASDPNNRRAIYIEGYVREVKWGDSQGDSGNCNATGKSQVDAILEIVPERNSPSDTDTRGKGMILANVTERSRRLAADGLLSGSKFFDMSGLEHNWSTKNLRENLKGCHVRVAGWLYYDAERHLESWRADPQDTRGRANGRETGWEIHPALGIRILTDAVATPGKFDEATRRRQAARPAS